MGRTACTESQCLYKGALYLYLTGIYLDIMKMEADGSLETCVFREVFNLYFIGLYQVFEYVLLFLLPVVAKTLEQQRNVIR